MREGGTKITKVGAPFLLLRVKSKDEAVSYDQGKAGAFINSRGHYSYGTVFQPEVEFPYVRV